MKKNTLHIIYGLLALVIGAAAWRGYNQAKAIAGGVVEGVTPTSDQNIAYKGVNAVGSVLTGDKSFSLGSWIYDKLNPDQEPPATTSGDDYIVNSDRNEGIAE